MDEIWSPDRDQWRQASSAKPQDTRIRAQAWAAKRQAASNKLDKAWALGYSGIMKASVNFEWRKKEEPDTSAEFYIRTALKAAGYTVGHIAVQGVWDEDKPQFPGGKWDATRLPHEEITK